MGAGNPEELRQLRAGEKERHAALEADHDALGDEVDDRPGPDEPGEERDQRDEERRAGGERAEPGGIATGDLAERGTDEKRNGRGDRDGRVARTAEQPENQSAEETGVETRLRGEVGKGRIAEAGRHHVGRERDAGDEVAAQPGAVVGSEPAKRRHGAGEDTGDRFHRSGLAFAR